MDVRSLPGSNRYPQYNAENLSKSLEKEGIKYIHLKEVGGLRKTSPDSINTGFRNKSFRGYADYMQTAEFEEELKSLIQIAEKDKTAIMCAEAVPWKCHRNLLSDALTIRGWEVLEIISDADPKLHSIISFARVEGQKIFYPKSGQEKLNL